MSVLGFLGLGDRCSLGPTLNEPSKMTGIVHENLTLGRLFLLNLLLRPRASPGFLALNTSLALCI